MPHAGKEEKGSLPNNGGFWSNPTGDPTLRRALTSHRIRICHFDIRRLFQKGNFQVKLFWNSVRGLVTVAGPNDILDVQLGSGLFPGLPNSDLRNNTKNNNES